VKGWWVGRIGLCLDWLLVKRGFWLSDLVNHLDFYFQRTTTQVSLTKGTLLTKESKVCLVRTESLRCPHFDSPGVTFVWLHLLRQDNNVVLPLRVTKVSQLIPHTGTLWPRCFADVNRRPLADEEIFRNDFNLVLLTSIRNTIFGEDVRLSWLGRTNFFLEILELLFQ
jgi:hypothetical protein